MKSITGSLHRGWRRLLGSQQVMLMLRIGLGSILIATLVLSPVSSSVASTDVANVVEPSPEAIASGNSLDLAADVALESGRQALLYFYSEECSYCQKQGPIIDELETEYGKDVAFVRVDLESDVQVTKEYGVTAVPTMVLSYGKDSWGEHEYQRFEGFTERDALEPYLEDVGYVWTDGVASSDTEAAAPAPPVEDCDSYDDHGKILKCKNKKLLDEVCGGNDTNGSGTVSLISQARHLLSLSGHSLKQEGDDEELRAQCKFATVMLDETEPAEFKSIALKRNADKKGFAEYGPLGDGDGICNKGGKPKTPYPSDGDPIPGYGEWCAEDDEDGIGDDDGICERLRVGNKWIREACLSISDTEAIDTNDENFNKPELEAYGTYLDDTLGGIQEANQQLAVMVADLKEHQLQARTLDGSLADTCDAMLYTDLWFGGELYDEHLPPLGISIFLDVYFVGDLLYNVCSSVAGTTILGMNAKGVCAVPAVIKSIAELGWETWELLEDSITGMHAQNTARCLAYHDDQQTLGFNAVSAQLIAGFEGISDQQTAGLNAISAQQTAEFGTVNDGLGNQTQALEEVKGRLDNKVELRRVHLQVIELEPKRKFLVSATEAGRPIADVELVALGVSEGNPVRFHDLMENIQWTSIETGIYILDLDLPPRLKNVELYKIEVKHAADPDEEHFGFVLFARSTQNTICAGQ